MQAYQHALRESHHSLVRNTSLKQRSKKKATKVSSESSYLVYAESIVYPKGLLFLLDFEELWERVPLSKAYVLSFAIIEACRVLKLKMITGKGNLFYSGEPRVKAESQDTHE